MEIRWPRAGACAPVKAKLKVQPEDFRVRELLAVTPSGSGEHLFLFAEKVNLTTREAATRLARAYGVPVRDVGYAGMKDKRAVACQWFSLPSSAEGRIETVDEFADRRLAVLDWVRHSRKLKRGELAGNAFCIRLRDVDPGAAAAPLEAMASRGAPNYFGAQRFAADNLDNALAWLPQRRRRRVSRFTQGLYLSVLRAFLFNEVLAARVRDGSWQRLICGDVAEAGEPTGPLWGRGRPPAGGRAAAIEAGALAAHGELLEGLEHAGVRQQRRRLRLLPTSFRYQQDLPGQVLVEFTLPPGGYATALLGDGFDLEMPRAHEQL